MSLHPFLIIGHRGAPQFEPENTLASFARAVEVDGANALELDISLTRDGELVVWHDWDPRDITARARRLGLEPDVAFRPYFPRDRRLRRPVASLTVDELRAHYGYATKKRPAARIMTAPICTLRDVVAWAVQRPELSALFLDVKIPPRDAWLVPAFLDRLRVVMRPLVAGRRIDITVETEHPTVLAAMKAHAPELSYTLDCKLTHLFSTSAVELAVHHGNTVTTLERPRRVFPLLWRAFCAVARTELARRTAHNAICPPPLRIKRVVGYVVNEVEEILPLLALGFDGLQSDRPHLLRRVIDEVRSGARTLIPPLHASPLLAA